MSKISLGALNFQHNSVGDEKLKLIAELQKELERPVYNKARISELYSQVEDYIEINVLRGGIRNKVIEKKQSGYQVLVNGCGDYVGFIDFKRDRFDEVTQRNIAQVIKALNADIPCMVELESRNIMAQFNTEALAGQYGYQMSIEGTDPRGIDVGLYSKFPLGRIRSNIFDLDTNGKPLFSCDCLEVEVITGAAQSIFLLVNHLKSKSGGSQEANNERRRQQAEWVNALLQERYTLDRDLVVVAGDFNNTPEAVPLRPLLQESGLADILALQFPDQPAERWTYHYDTNQQIDYILVSPLLRQIFRKAGVQRRGIANVEHFSDGQIQPFLSVTSWRNAALDHGAVWAEFEV